MAAHGTGGAVTPDDPKALARHGYDALSARYDEAYGGDGKYRAWLAELQALLGGRSRVLDPGCGAACPPRAS